MVCVDGSPPAAGEVIYGVIDHRPRMVDRVDGETVWVKPVHGGRAWPVYNISMLYTRTDSRNPAGGGEP